MKVEFHSGVAEPVAHACRLLRKAHGAGARVVVRGPAPLLNRLDELLWTHEPLSFVPHLRLRGSARPSAAQRRTPLWLVDDAQAVDDREVLVNLGDELVPQWDAFARVIEIVGTDPAQVSAGRQRWRHYGERPGVERVHHVFASAA